MADFKCIKDPIYGYVRIPVGVIDNYVNAPLFQRLRFVNQAGYTALFPSSTHNRFVHSIGVYYLGRHVSHSVQAALSDDLKEKWKDYFDVFELACLLHDVGHAPFSHTGEGFYLPKKDDYSDIHRQLAESISDDSSVITKLKEEFSDIEKKAKSAKPHELMSAIVGIRDFLRFQGDFVEDQHFDFFARAIAGYEYTDASALKPGDGSPTDMSFANALISLLNSAVVDVDKLDYLLRDAYLLGFDTVRVDYQRLVNCVTIEPVGTKCEVVFGKNAVSVLENVVYGRDAERKWLQGHPIVLYEADLLKQAIVETLQTYELNPTDLFCYEALSSRGTVKVAGVPVRYLCDADLLFWMKSCGGEKALQYFDRTKWYKPIWKSEFEFRSIFSADDWTQKQIDCLFVALSCLKEYVGALNGGSGWLDEDVIAKGCADLESLRAMPESAGPMGKLNVDGHALLLDLIDVFKRIADEFHVKFKFVIVENKTFCSGFSTDDLKRILVKLHDGASPVSFGRTLTSEKEQFDSLFYLFSEERFPAGAHVAETLAKFLNNFVRDNKELIQQYSELLQSR